MPSGARSPRPLREEPMPAERFDFPNAEGQSLAALLDRPDREPRACALFAHCFTCGKDVHAARRIAEGLTALGIAVLRFDFTGLGASEGEFANTTFSSNVADLVAAANALRRRGRAPSILIGHSLGGAAVLAAAHDVPEARAVVTIAAPCDPAHVTGLFKDHLDDIGAKGEVEVALAGRPFRIRRAFLDDIAEQNLTERIARLHKALLIFHSPTDDIVGIENAGHIFAAAMHPKSFVSLAGADHLLSRRSDATYVANVLHAWAERYLEAPEVVPDLAVEPVEVGGLDSGPGPYDLVLAGLGACTAMTLRLYAERKALPLDRVSVRLSHSRIHAADCESCETKEGMIDRIERAITLHGSLGAEERRRLMEIADKCPVHR